MHMSKAILLSLSFLSTAAAAEIRGLYQSSCQQTPEPGISVRSSINFGQIMARQTQVIYSDLECGQGAWAFQAIGPFTLDSEGALNLTTSAFSIIPLDASVAVTFNQIEFCGLSNWKFNTSQDVTGLSCRDFPFPAAGTVSYDRVQEVEGGIVFGALSQQFDGSSEAKRPVSLDMNNVFEATTVPK